MSQVESYQNSSVNHDKEQEALLAVQTQSRRRKLRARLKCMRYCCIFTFVLLIAFAIYVVTISAIRTRDIRHHQVIAEHQIALLNSKKQKSEIGCKSILILMRHCEKKGPETTDVNNNRHCSAAGMKRAEFLPSLFGKDAKYANPTLLYALSTQRPGSHHQNFREIETLTPLAIQANVTIHTGYTTGQEPYLAEHIFNKLASGNLCDKVSVISWKHTHIPAMSASLGCGRSEGCPDIYPRNNFEQMWILHYSYELPPPPEDRALKKKIIGTWSVHGNVTEERLPRNSH